MNGRDAIRALSRLLGTAAKAREVGPLGQALVREARAMSGVSSAVLLGIDAAGAISVVASDPSLGGPGEAAAADRLPALGEALARGLPARLDAHAAGELARLAALEAAPASALLLPSRPSNGSRAFALVLVDARGDVPASDLEAGAAFAAASLSQLEVLERHGEQVARQAALARAAKALNESLDLARVLPRICDEAAAILGADAVCVYRGSAASGLVLEASNLSPELVGQRVEPGTGIAGRAIALGRALLTSDEEDGPALPAGSPFAGLHSAMAAPMRWDGELRGVVWVGYRGERQASDDGLRLLESFADLAAVACRNASVHAALAEAARKDPLTGSLNHAALHDTLRREMQRGRRTGRRLSIVMVDLDHFKHVNERHGHLIGDEVLRRVARALREAVRPYDFVARYGGDEFAIVAVDADEERAAEIAERAIGRIEPAVGDLLDDIPGPHATAGVAEWRGAADASELVRQADRALLYGKQEGVRGAAVTAASVPEDFVLGRPADERPPAGQPAAPWPSAVRRETESVRRRSRQLAFANELGARLAAKQRVGELTRMAVDELRRAFSLERCGIVRALAGGGVELLAHAGAHGGGERPTQAGVEEAVERCLEERRSVVVSGGDAGAASGAGELSAMAVPLVCGDDAIGALIVEPPGGTELGDADVRLFETVAHQVAAALQAARRFEQLERDYLVTADALAAALESSDSYQPGHTRSIAERAEAVGRRLGMDSDELRTLRFAALLHDIGKVSVPDGILRKSGPLTDAERRQVERHAVVAEQILAPVESLSAVRPLVRHAHERWDGRGYPDGLAGDRIPSGARVLLVCDAHEAMTTDRPYRRALSADDARRELSQAAGTQFDARVVDAFLSVVGADDQ